VFLVAIGAPTVGADEAIRMQVALQPDHANACIKQLGDRKINHTAMIPPGMLATHGPTTFQVSNNEELKEICSVSIYCLAFRGAQC
jgi:hypothetical protein